MGLTSHESILKAYKHMHSCVRGVPLALAGGVPGSGAFEPWLQELWRQPHQADGLDLRVAKGLGSKGYGKLRISVVAPQRLEAVDFNFSYQEPFRYRWREHFLHSKLVDAEVGKNLFQIAGHTVQAPGKALQIERWRPGGPAIGGRRRACGLLVGPLLLLQVDPVCLCGEVPDLPALHRDVERRLQGLSATFLDAFQAVSGMSSLRKGGRTSGSQHEHVRDLGGQLLRPNRPRTPF